MQNEDNNYRSTSSSKPRQESLLRPILAKGMEPLQQQQQQPHSTGSSGSSHPSHGIHGLDRDFADTHHIPIQPRQRIERSGNQISMEQRSPTSPLGPMPISQSQGSTQNSGSLSTPAGQKHRGNGNEPYQPVSEPGSKSAAPMRDIFPYPKHLGFEGQDGGNHEEERQSTSRANHQQYGSPSDMQLNLTGSNFRAMPSDPAEMEENYARRKRALEEISRVAMRAESVGKRPPKDMKRLKKGMWYEVLRVGHWGDTPAVLLKAEGQLTAAEDKEIRESYFKPPRAFSAFEFQPGDRIKLGRVGYSRSRNLIAMSIDVDPVKFPKGGSGYGRSSYYSKGPMSPSRAEMLKNAELLGNLSAIAEMNGEGQIKKQRTTGTGIGNQSPSNVFASDKDHDNSHLDGNRTKYEGNDVQNNLLLNPIYLAQLQWAAQQQMNMSGVSPEADEENDKNNDENEDDTSEGNDAEETKDDNMQPVRTVTPVDESEEFDENDDGGETVDENDMAREARDENGYGKEEFDEVDNEN